MHSHDLARALLAKPDLPVVVSVDLSTEDEATSGDRAFGDVYTLNPDAATMVICAEAGCLNLTRQGEAMGFLDLRAIGLLAVLEVARQQAVSLDRPDVASAYQVMWILVLMWFIGKRR